MGDGAKRIHLLCSCLNGDHQIMVSHWPDDFDAIYVDARLTPVASLWRRLRTAFRHVLGRSPCGFGDWAEVIISDPSDARDLIAVLQSFVDSKASASQHGGAP